ncbi:MAG TPA: MerR family transcriptional regulator [Candidatus Hydrogenedens sp.]|nr:MerR family transcriptional regulator [Candidatus Hydrogenedens sp.]
MIKKTEKIYTIKYVSEQTGVPISRIRQWEKKIKKLKPKRHPKTNWRFYTDEDIKTVRDVIFLLKNRKIRLKGIDAELVRIENSASMQIDRLEVQNLLRQVRTELNQIRFLVKSVWNKE